MNLNIVTQAAVTLKKEYCDLPNLISSTLYQTFLEQKAKRICAFELIQNKNSACSIGFVENLSRHSGESSSIQLISQSSDVNSIIGITPLPFQQSSLSISIPTPIIKIFTVGNLLIAVAKHAVYELHSEKSLAFVEPVFKVFSVGFHSNVFRAVLYHADGSLTQMSIDAKTVDIQVCLLTKNNTIRSAVLTENAILYFTFDSKLSMIKLKENGQVTHSSICLQAKSEHSGSLPERLQVADMKWDFKNQLLYILCNKNLILLAQSLSVIQRFLCCFGSKKTTVAVS